MSYWLGVNRLAARISTVGISWSLRRISEHFSAPNRKRVQARLRRDKTQRRVIDLPRLRTLGQRFGRDEQRCGPSAPRFGDRGYGCRHGKGREE